MGGFEGQEVSFPGWAFGDVYLRDKIVGHELAMALWRMENMKRVHAPHVIGHSRIEVLAMMVYNDIRSTLCL